MSLAHPNVIDLVSHDPDTDTVTLSMVEERPWDQDGDLLLELQEKLNTYLAYALDGQLERDYPAMKGKAICFCLCYDHEPGTLERDFIALVQREWLIPSGIAWEESRLTV